ncbi:MAG: ABC transporter ATP-binding protein, partial [Alphaproteobacteria bacterium]|nr:ABC transporter ATP-binding protein [Alphaproteobacteria bacterium]
GPNGAGKSTLLKGISGALKPLEGAIRLDGVKARDIAYLPQAAEVDRSFPVNVFDLVATGSWRQTGLFGAITGAIGKRAFEAIAAVGLTGFEDRHIGALSGGQVQRALFARVLLQDAPVILLDEPFNAIDTRTVADLLDLIARWHGEQRTVIAVLHDLDIVRKHFPRALLLAREKIAWGETGEVLRADNLLAARRMCEAFDREAHECERAA